MLTQSELEREKYEARLKYQRDELSRRLENEQLEKRIQEGMQLVREAEQRVHDAEQRGIQLGEQRGIQLGEQRGELLGRVRLAERLLKQEPIPKETLQAMTSEQLQELAERLEAQLLGMPFSLSTFE